MEGYFLTFHKFVKVKTKLVADFLFVKLYNFIGLQQSQNALIANIPKCQLHKHTEFLYCGMHHTYSQ
jgi:hypothetical protein